MFVTKILNMHHSHVRDQIKKNFGLWDDDNLIRLKIYNPKNNIGNDLDETN